MNRSVLPIASILKKYWISSKIVSRHINGGGVPSSAGEISSTFDAYCWKRPNSLALWVHKFWHIDTSHKMKRRRPQMRNRSSVLYHRPRIEVSVLLRCPAYFSVRFPWTNVAPSTLLFKSQNVAWIVLGIIHLNCQLVLTHTQTNDLTSYSILDLQFVVSTHTFVRNQIWNHLVTILKQYTFLDDEPIFLATLW